MTPPEPGTAARTFEPGTLGPRVPKQVVRRSGPALPADAHLISQFDVNVLIVGTDTQCESVITAVWSTLRAPVMTWHRPASLASIHRTGLNTLLVRRVDELGRDEQDALLDWLEDPIPVRVVSTSSVSLLKRVERGQFLPALYYRLNTLYIPFDSCP